MSEPETLQGWRRRALAAEEAERAARNDNARLRAELQALTARSAEAIRVLEQIESVEIINIAQTGGEA